MIQRNDRLGIARFGEDKPYSKARVMGIVKNYAIVRWEGDLGGISHYPINTNGWIDSLYNRRCRFIKIGEDE